MFADQRFSRAHRAICVPLLGILLVACAATVPVSPDEGLRGARPAVPPSAASLSRSETPGLVAPALTDEPPASAPSEPVPVVTVPARVSTPDQVMARGLASWYGPKFHGRRTASGERYDMHALTAAHRSLPFGTRVRVRSVSTGQEVVVRINDRGPYRNSRIIDLSLGAITALGLRNRGVTEVVLLRE